MYDEIDVVGEFEIAINGKTKYRGKNKWMYGFMQSIAQVVANGVSPNWYGAGLVRYCRYMGYGATARVGRDTSTPTEAHSWGLVDAIDIAPSSVTRKLWKDDEANLYVAEFQFVWNAEVLPDTQIGEFGVWLNSSHYDMTETEIVNPSLFTHHGGIDPPCSPFANASVDCCVRVASADGAFDPFYHYGSVNSLTFIWRFQVMIL